jgi:hypothetical protein
MARRPLISRLPEIWRRLDKDGELAAFLGLWDFELDAVHTKITELLSIRNLDKIPDRFLILLADLVGHRWRSDKSKDWNRNRMRDSIRRHSYKGTLAQLEDLVAEHNGTGLDFIDMASKLLVLGKNGRLGCTDAALVSPDYYHDGAFEVRVDRRISYDEFLEDLQHTKPAGEVWFFSLLFYLSFAFEEAWAYRRYTHHDDANTHEGTIGFGLLGIDLRLSTESSGDAWRQSGEVGWSHHAKRGGLGFDLLGKGLFLSTEANGGTARQNHPVGWHPTGNTLEGTIGHSPIGKGNP